MDKFLITMIWVLSLLGVGFMSHEFGFMNGQDYQKSVDGAQLSNCQRIIAGSLYEQ